LPLRDGNKTFYTAIRANDSCPLVKGTLTCPAPVVSPKYPVRQCTLNGWIKTGEFRDGANWNGNIGQKPSYNIGDKVSTDQTPYASQCQPPKKYPVRQCTAA
jgi:hypothetical protein